MYNNYYVIFLELYELGELLGVDGEDIKRGLTTSSNLLFGISAKEAYTNKDKLSHALYIRLFSWLMNKINQSVKTEAKYKRKCIGFLDIFGFDFSENQMDWDNFVINTCNEKVHNIVTSLTLKGEQHEYLVDKIHWCLIPFYDNTSVCKLLYSVQFLFTIQYSKEYFTFCITYIFFVKF